MSAPSGAVNMAPARRSNYDLTPFVEVPGGEAGCVEGWEGIAARLKKACESAGHSKTVVVVECYHGVSEESVLAELIARVHPVLGLAASDALLPPAAVEKLVSPFLGGGDPVFGRMSDLKLARFFDAGKIGTLRSQIDGIAAGIVLVVGCGARLIAEGDILVYADMARWELQRRQRKNEIANLGSQDYSLAPSLKYKRAYFVDWRVCDQWKIPLIEEWDFLLDTNRNDAPKLADGDAVRRGQREAVSRPFRVVPFFDPAPWGGQWLKKHFDLDPSVRNYGWGFDCVPEENSLLLGFGAKRVELPAIDVVLSQPKALLGDAVVSQFGAEFPIRFDFLDTMEGGSLSFQVHPLTAYIRKEFGVDYTQDESYYILDAGPDAFVCLGVRDGVDSGKMMSAIKAAQAGGPPFPAEQFANFWPAKKHDHFLIPAGTVHCAGTDAVVLEISATPYIFTFKLWDWGRVGLDGKPRPIHLNHGEANIQWDRTAEWTKRNLVNQFEPIAEGPGWREERTGLHALQFIETRRHWFTGTVAHDTLGGVNVLNLIEGSEAIVESPSAAFAPFIVHYGETFIVPASVGAYTVRPHGQSGPCATIKAFVRTPRAN